MAESTHPVERRLTLGIAVALALVVALGALCLLALRRSVALDRKAFEQANSIVDFGNFRTALERKMNAFRRYLETPQESSAAELNAARQEMREILIEFERKANPSERKLLERIGTAEEAHQAVIAQAVARRRSGESRDTIATYLVRESGSRRRDLEGAIDRFFQIERADMDEVENASRSQSGRATTFVGVITLIAVAVVAMQGRSMARRLTRSFQIEQLQRERAQAAESRSTFLAEASQVLGSSLSYRATLSSVARLAVPKIADWCFVDMIEDGNVQRVAVVAPSDEHAAFARELEERHLLDPRARKGPPNVVRTGEPELLPQISDEFLENIARTPEDFLVLSGMGIRSYMCVPVRAREEILGILTFLVTESSRSYGEGDLLLAQELARRAGAAIDNARLYRDAREAIHLRDDFLSVASHELKTPITTLQLQIQSFARRMRAGPELATPAKLLPRLETAERQVDRLARLVNDLLDISRITAGRMALQREAVDLNAVVEETLVRSSMEFERARCSVEFHAAGSSHVGEWDRTRVEQIVTNLLSNACKYGAGAPVEVTLTSNEEAAYLSVRDHGIGIDAADQTRIFDRFERAVSVRHYGGLGLGLWIVRQIVETLGGRIRVESRQGEGSTFTVELPKRAAMAPARWAWP